jgi:membrane protein DedA with SNARE-associated domain
MGVVRFSVLTLLGSIPWNLGLAYAGFRLGRDYKAIEQAIGVFTIPIAILVVILLVVAYLLGRRWLESESLPERDSVA